MPDGVQIRSVPTDHIRETLTEILVEDLDIPTSDVSGSSLLIEDLGLDSVAFAIGVVAIEERLGAALTEREILDAKSVDELEELVRTKLSEQDR